MVSLAFSTIEFYKPPFDKYSFYYISHSSYTVCVTSLETSSMDVIVQASDIEDLFHTWHTCMRWCIIGPITCAKRLLGLCCKCFLIFAFCAVQQHLRLVSVLISFTVPYLIASTIIAEEFEFWTLPLYSFFISFQFCLRATHLLKILFLKIFFSFSMMDKVLHLCRHAEVKNWSSHITWF